MKISTDTLHVHCGDCSAGVLRQSGMPGKVVVIHDCVHEGPTPAGGAGLEWYQLRAEYLVSIGVPEKPVVLAQKLADEDRILDDLSSYDEVVLWFDHCLFDQAILIRLLDRLGQQDLGRTRLSLICVGEFPGFAKFCGLGELSPPQMASLADKRHEVTAAEKTLAAVAWSAFRSPDPRAIEQLLATRDTTMLPYLAGALVRHLEQLPSAGNGLNRVESEALEAVAAGHTGLVGIFKAVSDREARPFLGDTMLWNCLDQLARAEHPALRISGPGPIPRWNPPANLSAWSVELTDTGRQLLAGIADWVKLNGLERWLGGVRLHGPVAAWRFDGQTRKLVAAYG